LFSKHEDLLIENNVDIDLLKEIPVEDQYFLIEELSHRKKFTKNKMLLDAHTIPN